MKTKLIDSITGKSKPIDQQINSWIEKQVGIRVVDIKFQTKLAETDRNTLTMVYSALILYEDNDFVDYIMKKDKLSKELKPKEDSQK